MYKLKKLMFVFLFLILISRAYSLSINSVSTNPEKISPGEISKIAISLKNNGDYDLEDVSISLEFTNLPIAPYDSGSEIVINELESGKTKEVEFNIIAFNDAKPGIYKIPVKIEYNEDGIKKTKQSLISIIINSEPIIDVIVEEGLLLKGQKNTIVVKIINKGLGDAKFLEMELGTSTNYNILSQTKVYIGDVESNDFQTEEFQVYFNENSLKTISLPIKVKYKDINNKEYEKKYDVQLKVYTLEQARNLGLTPKNNTIYIGYLIIILIIIFFVYRIIKKMQKSIKD